LSIYPKIFAKQDHANKSNRSITKKFREYFTRVGANGKKKGEAKYIVM
jgi:hypothetical protein